MRVITKAPAKITRATIEAAWRQRAPGERLIVRDKECRGLALIVNATSMAWSFSYRPRGVDPRTNKRWPNRTVTLGNPASHSPEAARTAANRIKGEVKGGADPAAEKKAAAEAERRKRSATLNRLAGEYERALPHRQKMRGSGLPSAGYVAIELAQVRLALQAMDAEETPAADLSSADIRKLLSAGTNEAGNARARFGALSRFLDWAQDAGHITTNPCAEIARTRRPRAPQGRAHYTFQRPSWRGCGTPRSSFLSRYGAIFPDS